MDDSDKIIDVMKLCDKETWESFSDFLSSKGLRVTGQRKGVLEALFRQSGHFTADQLLQDAQNLDETVEEENGKPKKKGFFKKLKNKFNKSDS